MFNSHLAFRLLSFECFQMEALGILASIVPSLNDPHDEQATQTARYGRYQVRVFGLGEYGRPRAEDCAQETYSDKDNRREHDIGCFRNSALRFLLRLRPRELAVVAKALRETSQRSFDAGFTIGAGVQDFYYDTVVCIQIIEREQDFTGMVLVDQFDVDDILTGL